MKFSNEMFDVSENTDDDEIIIGISEDETENLRQFIFKQDCKMADLLTAALILFLAECMIIIFLMFSIYQTEILIL